MSSRLKGRRRQAEAVIARLTEWVQNRDDVDPGTANVLRDGHRLLHDPKGLFTKALAEL